MYSRYEMAVHGKDRGATEFNDSYCNSPIYDPESNDPIMNRPPELDDSKIDEGRESKDEGLYPGLGSYHMYHRINGKLVALSVIDILKTQLQSKYFVYDVDYNFLYLGVISAIHEIEYMKMVQKKFNPDLKYYVLGSFMLNSPKYIYKLNYKPGLVLCPKSLKLVPLTISEPKMKAYMTMKKEDRDKLDYLTLDAEISDDKLQSRDIGTGNIE